MLLIEVPKNEIWDEGTKTFIYVEKQTLKLEHSLVSIHKWESKYHKPFMTKNEKTKEEEIDYIRFMTLDKNIDPYVYFALTNDNKKEIQPAVINKSIVDTQGIGHTECLHSCQENCEISCDFLNSLVSFCTVFSPFFQGGDDSGQELHNDG